MKLKKGNVDEFLKRNCANLPESVLKNSEYAEMVYYFCNTQYLAGVDSRDNN